MSFWDDLFGSPSDTALEMYSYEDMEEMLNEYYGAWREAGLRALPTMEEQMMMLLYSPEVIHQMMGATYEESPGYQYQMEESMNAVNQAAAAGGMLGTPSHQTQAASIASDQANQDYWNYVNHLTDLYYKGLGVGQDINQMGYNASSAIASDLARFMGAQMGLAYQGAAAQQASMLGALGAAGSAATGGMM